ncbi:alpha/beta hydrolase-fold protein [Streptomyces chartreusis]|uniref:Enterochelin esterase n=1 Tax=Streptomyces chartreusis TaxID=1969 RepID=A0A7H8TL89_STRCX|nr:alpha/beta hydrolase-fold protein [Streptomyces chartreusis]QKZ23782.1 enterochelin esterase [Streptomyces chartreusis]
MRPVTADTENAFAGFGMPGEPGTEEFWAAAEAPKSVPAGGGGWATLFLWRGSAASIDFESWSEPVPLNRWGDTDCWYAEVRMPARLRVTYRFLVGDAAHADPLNPVGAGGDRSIAATPDAPPQPHWPVVGPGTDAVLPLPRARVRWASERLGGRRTVRVHPVGGGGPVVLLLDGDDWLYLHPAMTAFDSAFAAGDMPPVTLVFLPAKDRAAEFTCRPELWEAVRDELLPLVAESGVPADLGRLVVAGQSLGGLSALYAALRFPDLVSRVACQSGSFWWTPEAMDLADPMSGPVGGSIAARLLERPELSRLRIAFDVGEHETRMLPHCERTELLTEQAGATVRVSRSAAGHDRAGWRHALLRDVAWALGRRVTGPRPGSSPRRRPAGSDGCPRP